MRSGCFLTLASAFCGELLLGGVLHAQPANIGINIIYPAAGALVGDDLQVVAAVSSTFEIKAVVAQVEGRQMNLVFTPTAYSDQFDSYPGWTNTLSLSGLVRGTKALTVQATDFLDNSAQAERMFVYDRKPVLSVSAPLGGTVARPQLRIAASCTDDDPAGCSLSVSADGPLGTVVLASGHDALDQVVSLAPFEGGAPVLHFAAVDSAGQRTAVDVSVYVESSLRLSEVEAVAAPIWDVQPEHILFLESRNDRGVLKIRQRATGQDIVVMDQPGRFPRYGALTPKGAMFIEQSGDVLTALLYDARDGALVELGFPNSAASLAVKGSCAIWNSGETLILRDLVAGTNTTVSTGAGNWMNDVADNGDVVYWTAGGGIAGYPPYNYNIYRYRAGATTKLTTDTDLWNVYPVTDGINVVYQKLDPCCGTQRHGLFLHDGAKEIELAPLALRPRNPLPGTDYQVNNGWVAFTRLGTGGQLQVWTRSPSGAESQLTFYGDSSRINALGNGEVMFWHGKRYLSRPAEVPIEINSALGNAFWQEGNWWITLGRSLFKVNTAAFPTISGLFTTTAGACGFQVGGAEGQQVIVQGSEDLSRWENLHTNTIAGGGFIFKDDAATALRQRFYRAVTP